MTLSELNIFAQPYSDVSDALPELDDVALAEVTSDGGILKLNSFGKTIWGWKKGGKIPSSLLSSLRDGTSLSLPDSKSGQNILGTGVQRDNGWLIVGYHEKTVNFGKAASSFRTLIENIPPVNHPFIEQAPHGILFLDRIGNVIFANQQFRDCLKLAKGEPLSQNVFQLFSFDRALASQIQALLAEGSAIIHETASPDPSMPHLLRINGSPVHDAGNSILGAVLTMEALRPDDDTTHLSTQDVEDHQLAQLKNVFIAMMSHEIRTPLGVMNGYAEILRQELDEYELATGNALPPQVKEFVGAIHENAQRLLGMVNELFDLSNMRQLKLSPILLHNVMEPVISKADRILSAKGVKFEVSLSDANPVIMGNATRVRQVLKNLLSNAVKFTNNGAVSLNTRLEGDFAVIEVADTGVGISQEYLDKLFTPFLQEDTRLNRDFQGTGLGLALAKLLIDLMNGRIEAESEKGKGSTFRIFLPAV